MKLSQVDDPQKDTDDVPHSDVPVVTVPRVDDQTSDGANQNKTDPKVCMYVCMYSMWMYVTMHVCVCVCVCMYAKQKQIGAIKKDAVK